MSNNEEINSEIKKVSGIDDFKNISEEDAKKLIELLENKKLTSQNLTALIEASPEVAKAIATVLSKVADATRQAQVGAFDAVKVTSENFKSTFEELARNAESDEARAKIAELVMRWAQCQENMNKDNNDTWRTYAKCAALVAIVAIVAWKFPEEAAEAAESLLG